MYFDTKNYLKSTRNHTAKHNLSQLDPFNSQERQNQDRIYQIYPNFLD